LTLDLNHLRAAVEENGAEHVNISAFHQNMLNDSNELKITQADDKVKIDSLEAQEKVVIEENDATQKELRGQLDKVEADLAAFQEITQLRQAYESGVTALASGGSGHEKVTALVEAELARTTAQDEAEALAAGEAEKKNNELVAEMQATEATFVEKLKNIRSAMNAQVQTSARTDEYSQKVKTELELSEEQLRVQTTKKLELQACLETLENEYNDVTGRIQQLDQSMVLLAQELATKQNELSNHTLKAKGCAEDIAEQIDDSQQVLSAKEEACVAAKQQLIELGGTPEQKQKFARLCAYVREMTQEKQIVDAIVIEHNTQKAAMEAQQSQIEADLKGNAENLEKQSRDVQYKIEVDSRAMQLRADYAQDLGSDVTAAKAIGAELDATLMVANIPAVPSPRSSSNHVHSESPRHSEVSAEPAAHDASQE